MGYRTEFNWVLKLKPEQGFDENALKEEGTYSFDKEELRIYPIDIPIDLVNEDWEAVAKVLVTQFTVGDGRTKGEYRVLKLYNDEERAVITNALKQFITKRSQERFEQISGSPG